MTVQAGQVAMTLLLVLQEWLFMQVGQVTMTLLLVLQECAGGAGRHDLIASVTRMCWRGGLPWPYC